MWTKRRWNLQGLQAKRLRGFAGCKIRSRAYGISRVLQGGTARHSGSLQAGRACCSLTRSYAARSLLGLWASSWQMFRHSDLSVGR